MGRSIKFRRMNVLLVFGPRRLALRKRSPKTPFGVSELRFPSAVISGPLVLTPLFVHAENGAVTNESENGEARNGVEANLLARNQPYEAEQLPEDEIDRLFQELITTRLINHLNQKY